MESNNIGKILETQPTAISEYFEMLGGDWKSYPTETNRRVRDFCQELSVKRLYNKFTTFKSEGDEMIIGNRLRVFSFCEHHLLLFYGEAAIGYIPDETIFGISKLQRMVDKWASRPQLQERLTSQIKNDINEILNPKGVAVRIKAVHTCVMSRGVQSTNAEITTMAVSGILKDNPQARNEFLQNINSDGFKI